MTTCIANKMFIFIVLVSLLLFQAIIFPQNDKEGKIRYLVFAFIEMQFVSGFRVADDGDTYYYGLMFSDIASQSLKEVLEYGTEMGYWILNYVLSRFSSNPQTIIFFTAAIVNFLVLRYIYKKSDSVWLSVIVYITLMYFFSSLNAVRNSLAYTILLYSNDYIVKRKLTKFSLVVLLATSFHFSVLFYFPIYFLYHLKLNPKNILIISIGVFLLMRAVTPLLTMLTAIHPRWDAYLQDDFYQSAFANILIFFVQLALFLLAIKRESTSLSKLSGEHKLYMMLMFMSVLMAFCAIDVMMISRFVTIFSIISIVYIPNLLLNPSKKKLNPGWTSLVLILSLLQMVIILMYRSEWYFAGTYKLLFF